MQDLFNEWHAKNTSQKVRNVFKSKGMSGAPLTINPPYGYLKDSESKNNWIVDEEEQKTLKAAVPEMQSFLETETDKTESLQRFIQKVKQITELKALTPELIHEFVDKIVVYAPKTIDSKRVQLLDIYYSDVGTLHELPPKEMEEAFQQHLIERNKEKTA